MPGSLLALTFNTGLKALSIAGRFFQPFPFGKSRDSVIKSTLVALSIPTGRFLFALAGLTGGRLWAAC
jgi:hypothetical protein